MVAQPVRVPGTVALDERRVTVIATRSDAYVDHVEDVTTGDRVRKGQPLVHIYSPDINAAAAQLIANPGFDGARRRLQNLNVSEAVIDEMERTRKVPMAIDTLFRIGDISVMWVLADVPERDLAGVRVGQAVTVRLRSAPGRTFSGKVGVIYPQVNPDTRATRVRIELPHGSWCCSTGAAGASSPARSGSGFAARATSRSATASPPATGWSRQRTS